MNKNYLLLFLSLFTFLPSQSMFKASGRGPSFSQIGSLLFRRYSQEFCEKKFTALKEAILRNAVNQAERLLNEGAWVRTLSFDQTAPLHVAAQVGNPKLLELLRAWNTPIDITNEMEETPLHIAARLNHVEFVKGLLQAKAYHGSRDINFRTPLHLPAFYGFEGVVAALLQAGAEVDACDNKALSSLWYATSANRIASLHLLLNKGARVNYPYEPCGDTVTHLAAKKGYEDAFFLLLKHGADVHARNRNLETPLHEAVKAEQLAIIHDLMLAGANAHAQDLEGVSPLDIAAQQFPYLVDDLSFDKIRR